VKNRIAISQNIQGLRGLAAILVVIYHIYKYEIIINEEGFLSSFWTIGRTGVDIFFVISGYIMVMISDPKKTGTRAATGFALRRIFRVYPLYWFFSFIILPIYLLQPQLFNRMGDSSDLNLWKSFLLIPQSNLAPLVGQGWTLIHEMYFYIVFSFLILFSQKLRNPLIFTWATVIAIFVWGVEAPKSPILDLALSPLTFEFLFGCGVALLHKNDLTKFGWVILLSGLGIFCFSETSSHGVNRLYWMGIPSALIVWGAVSLELENQWQAPSWLVKIGDTSYSLYLCHILVLSALLKVWKMFEFSNYLHTGFMCAAMFCASIITGFLIHRWVEKPLIQISKVILTKICPRF